MVYRKGCFVCGKFGHVVNNCKEVVSEHLKCGSNGHLKMYCQLMLRKCFGCGRVDQLKSDCNVASDKSLRVRRMSSTSDRRQGKGNENVCQGVGDFYIEDELMWEKVES